MDASRQHLLGLDVVVLDMVRVQQAELEVQYDPVTNFSSELFMPGNILGHTF